MQTTAQLRQALTGSKIIMCNKCRKSVVWGPNTFVDRQVEDDLIEIGLECPNCQTWFHSYFLNTDLRENRPKLSDGRAERRQYSKEFQKFQKKTRRRLGMKKVRGRWVRPDGLSD